MAARDGIRNSAEMLIGGRLDDAEFNAYLESAEEQLNNLVPLSKNIALVDLMPAGVGGGYEAPADMQRVYKISYLGMAVPQGDITRDPDSHFSAADVHDFVWNWNDGRIEVSPYSPGSLRIQYRRRERSISESVQPNFTTNAYSINYPDLYKYWIAHLHYERDQLQQLSSAMLAKFQYQARIANETETRKLL